MDRKISVGDRTCSECGNRSDNEGSLKHSNECSLKDAVDNFYYYLQNPKELTRVFVPYMPKILKKV